MPIFEYLCSDCGKHFDILFKTREVAEDVQCPTCASRTVKKKLSTFAASVSHSSDSSCTSGSCGLPSYGGCSGGMCGLN